MSVSEVKQQFKERKYGQVAERLLPLVDQGTTISSEVPALLNILRVSFFFFFITKPINTIPFTNEFFVRFKGEVSNTSMYRATIYGMISYE